MTEQTQERGKKQLILRLSPRLHKELAAWAQDDFRSLNGQIEYLLSDCLRRRRGIEAEERREKDG